MEFMGIKREIRKIAELGIGAIAIAALILAGCGGGGGGGGASTPAAGSSVTIVPFKGMFVSGSVTLKDNAGNPVTITGGGTISNGVASVTYTASASQYPLIVSVSGSYRDETKGGATQVAATPLRGFIASSAAAAAATTPATGIPVTAITEIAAAQVQLAASGVPGAISVNNVNTAINNVVAELGIPNTVPSFDANGGALDGNTVALEGIALSIASSNPGNLSAALTTVGQNLATALNNSSLSASAVAAVVTANLPGLSATIVTATGNNVTSLPPTATVPVGPPAIPPVIVPVQVVTTAAASNILTATTLLTRLHTGFIQQASGIQADLNSINSPSQEAQNFALFLYQGTMLASNGSLTNSSLSKSVTINGYPCVLTSLVSNVGTVYCQWANNNGNGKSTIHQLTITGPNVSTGLLNVIPVGTYTWSDTIIPSITLTISAAVGNSVDGITATGTEVGNGSSVTLNGSILPGEGTTLAHSSTNLTGLTVTITANTTSTPPTNTYGMTGTIAEMSGTTPFDSLVLSTGTQLVQNATDLHTISANLVMKATTQNYEMDGTLLMSAFAQDMSSSTNRNPGWNPGTISFTGSATGLNANAALGKFLITTGNGLVMTSDRTGYDPTQTLSATNYPTASGTFDGNIITGGATDSLNLTFASGAGATYNTITTTLTYTDSGSNAVTVTGTGSTTGATTLGAALGG